MRGRLRGNAAFGAEAVAGGVKSWRPKAPATPQNQETRKTRVEADRQIKEKSEIKLMIEYRAEVLTSLWAREGRQRIVEPMQRMGGERSPQGRRGNYNGPPTHTGPPEAATTPPAAL